LTNPEQIRENVLEDLRRNRLQLPTLPEVALHIRDEIQKSDANLNKIASIIMTDPALCAKLLRVVNSPLYRASKKIDNIKTAITRLGHKQIRNLVTSLVLQQMYHSTNVAVNKLLHQSWNHSARVAAIGSVISSSIKGLSTEQAVLAGLVHDIGILPLILHAENVPELISDPAAMRLLFKSLHTDVGSHVLSNWNFSSELIDVAKHHEELDYCHENSANYTDIIIVANLFAHYKGGGSINENWASISAFKRLGITADNDFMENADNIKAIKEIEKILRG